MVPLRVGAGGQGSQCGPNREKSTWRGPERELNGRMVESGAAFPCLLHALLRPDYLHTGVLFYCSTRIGWERGWDGDDCETLALVTKQRCCPSKALEPLKLSLKQPFPSLATCFESVIFLSVSNFRIQAGTSLGGHAFQKQGGVTAGHSSPVTGNSGDC